MFKAVKFLLNFTFNIYKIFNIFKIKYKVNYLHYNKKIFLIKNLFHFRNNKLSLL